MAKQKRFATNYRRRSVKRTRRTLGRKATFRPNATRQFIVAPKFQSGAVGHPYWESNLPKSGLIMETIELGDIDSTTSGSKIGGLLVFDFSVDDLIYQTNHTVNGVTRFTEGYINTVSVTVESSVKTSDVQGTIGVAVFPLGEDDQNKPTVKLDNTLNWVKRCPNGVIGKSQRRLVSTCHVTNRDMAFMLKPLGDTGSGKDDGVMRCCFIYYDLGQTTSDVASVTGLLENRATFNLVLKANVQLQGSGQRTLRSSVMIRKLSATGNIHFSEKSGYTGLRTFDRVSGTGGSPYAEACSGFEQLDMGSG